MSSSQGLHVLLLRLENRVHVSLSIPYLSAELGGPLPAIHCLTCSSSKAGNDIRYYSQYLEVNYRPIIEYSIQ